MVQRGQGPGTAEDALVDTARDSVRRFDRLSCLALLYAACSSTSSIDRLPSASVLLGQVLTGRSRGDQAATTADLHRWLTSLRSAVPSLARYEQVVPLTAGPAIHVLWDRTLWPLHPGRSQDPEAVVEQVRRYAQVADERLVPWLGFGISDIAAIALRVMALQRRYAGSHWADSAGDGPGSPEIDDTRAYLEDLLSDAPADDFPSWLSEGFPEAPGDSLRAAAAWCMQDAKDLAHGQWLLGGALLIRTDIGVLPAPAGLALDGLEATAERLLAMADQAPSLTGSPTIAQELQQQAEARFALSARGLATSLIGPVDTGRSGRLTCFMYPAARRVIAVHVVANTDPQTTAREVDRAKRHLRWIKPGAVATVDAPSGVQMPSGGDAPFVHVGPGHRLRIADDAVVRRVVLVDGPWKPRPESRRGAVVMHLDSWCRIAAGVMDDHEEFWAFLDEIAEMPGPRRVYGTAAADLWDAFQSQGVLPLDEADWHLAETGPANRWAERCAVDEHETVLRRLGLPGLRDWPFTSKLINGCVTVGATTPYEHTTVSVEPSLAVHVGSDDVAERQWMMILENAVRGGLTLLAEAEDGERAVAWQAWREAVTQPLRITFMAVPGLAGEGIKLVAVGEGQLVVGFVISVLNRTEPGDVHRLIGETLWCYLVGMFAAVRGGPDQQVIDVDAVARSNDAARQAGDAFLEGWSRLPLTSMFVRTSAERDVAPRGVAARLTDGGRARAQREITKRVLASGAALSELTTRNDIRERVMIPAALAIFQDRVARYHSAAILPVVATAIERHQAERTRTDHDRVIRRAVGWNELPDVDNVASGSVIAGRTADVLAEAVLAAAPGGTQRMDHRDWSALLHLGAVLLELSGEQAHIDAGVGSAGDDDPLGRSVAFDAQAYVIDSRRHHDRQTANGLVTPEREIVTTQLHDIDVWPYATWTSIMSEHRDGTKPGSPQWQTATAAVAAHRALQDEWGIGFDDIFAVLAVAADPPESDEIICIPAQTLIERVHDWSHLDQQRIRLAINLLTLTPDEVRREGLNIGRIEDRGARLAVRPLLPDLGTPDGLIIMPRRIGTSARLLLGYVSAARPPWPALSPATKRAFADWAQKQQREFEIDAEEQAKTTGYKVIRGLKPDKAARKGVHFSGEIDLLVIDERGRRIWVLEAKAGEVAMDASRLLHDIIDFHGVPQSTHPRWARYRAKKRPYVPTLLTKTAEIRQCVDALLAMAGISRGERDWSVLPLMLTPAPVPAAYVPDPQVPFTTLDVLAAVLKLPQTPRPGPLSDMPIA